MGQNFKFLGAEIAPFGFHAPVTNCAAFKGFSRIPGSTRTCFYGEAGGHFSWLSVNKRQLPAAEDKATLKTGSIRINRYVFWNRIRHQPSLSRSA